MQSKTKKLTRKLLLFALVGPLIGFAAFAAKPVFIWLIVMPYANPARHSNVSTFDVSALLLLGTYAVGLLPALAAAVADNYYSNHRRRRAITTLVAFLMGFFVATLLLRRISLMLVSVSLSAALAAYVCSWMSEFDLARR